MNYAGSKSPPALPDIDWGMLLRLTRLYTLDQMSRHRFRGDFGGVPPDGYDADGITSEVVARVYQELSQPPASAPQSSLSPIQQCQRHAYNTVHTLSKRIENFVVRNEPDLQRVYVDGDLLSPVDLFPDPRPDPAHALLLKEKADQLCAFRQNFRAFLGNDPILRDTFDCFCADIKKPQAIAAMLRIDPAHAKIALERLYRRLDLFLRKNPDSSPPATPPRLVAIRKHLRTWPPFACPHSFASLRTSAFGFRITQPPPAHSVSP